MLSLAFSGENPFAMRQGRINGGIFLIKLLSFGRQPPLLACGLPYGQDVLVHGTSQGETGAMPTQMAYVEGFVSLGRSGGPGLVRRVHEMHAAGAFQVVHDSLKSGGLCLCRQDDGKKSQKSSK